MPSCRRATTTPTSANGKTTTSDDRSAPVATWRVARLSGIASTISATTTAHTAVAIAGVASLIRPVIADRLGADRSENATNIGPDAEVPVPQPQLGCLAGSEEWPGNSLRAGSMTTAALLTAVAASPRPTEISRTLPGYSVMSPAAKMRGTLVAIV